MTALTFVLASALLAPAAPKAPESVHILAIELAADGRGGSIRTEAVRLAGEDAELRFGEGACRKYPLADRVLEQLFTAMHGNAPVAFETEAVGSTQCVRRVRFLSPRA
jgi:hypothetical protein